MKPRTPRRGQALLMTTISLAVVFGTVGLAVDVGWAYYRREAAQAAADAAAMAAVRAALIDSPSGISCGVNSVWCGSPGGTATDCPATAPTSAGSTFDNACMMAAANGFTTSGRRRVSVQANNTSSAPTVSGVTTNYWAVVKVTDSPSGFFGALTGSAFQSTARATAAVMGGGGSGAGCVYVLDPHATDAFDAGNNNSISSQCGIYVNSDATGSSEAMHVYGSAHVTATNGASINVVGKAKADNGGVISPSPTTATTAAADPFSSLPSPTPANTCLAGNFTSWQPTQYTPAPGTYCTFQLGNGMNAQLSSGTYIINGGSFSVQGGSTLTATGGVLIYLTGGAYVNIANGTTITLQAQSSGSYQGVLFYQDRTMTNPTGSTLAGGSTMNLQGSIYMPHALLTIDNGNQTRTMGIVVDKVKFQGGAQINVATNASQTGLPVAATPTVAMIE
jgi:hypothetical protein